MKLNIVSDLHLGVSKKHDKKLIQAIQDDSSRSDVLMVCGDLAVAESIQGPLRAFCEAYEKGVLYCMGNHLFYGSSIAKMRTWIYRQDWPGNFYFLDNSSATIDDIYFYGGTMWFSKREANRDTSRNKAWQLKTCLSDFGMIHGFEGVEGFARENRLFLNNLILSAQQRQPDVIISHHIPHSFGIAIDHIGSPLNRFFYCPEAQELLDEDIVKPKLWCYGHTHSKHDFTTLKETRFVCNPVGYLHEKNLKYEAKIIEIKGED